MSGVSEQGKRSGWLPCLLRRLQRLCVTINSGTEYCLFGLGLTMTLVVLLQVFCRYLLNSSLFWSEELARYLLVWLSFLGATVAYYHQLHPGVDVLTRRLPQSGRRGARFMVHLVTLGVALVMILAGSRFAWFVRLQISPALGLPKWIVLAVIPLCGLLLLVHALAFLLENLLEEGR